MRSAVIALALVGCNPLLGIEEAESARDSGGDGGTDVCAPIPFDPARYSFGGGAARAWSTARTECGAYQGMDLVVVNANEPLELAQVFNLGTPPYWLGISFDGTAWVTVDGCTPALPWAPGEPATERVGDCALRTNAGLASTLCTNATYGNASPIVPLCETPRSSASCLAQQTRSTYMRLGDMRYNDASTACLAQGMHLVEINSSAELGQIKQMFPAVAFWTGATRDPNTFASPTGCPQIFAWHAGQPMINAGGCVYHDGAGMAVISCDSSAAYPALCESNT